MLIDIQDTLYELIKNHFGEAFAVCVLIVGGVLSGIIWLSIWLYKVVHLKKDIKNLPCKEHGEKLDRVVAVETKVESLPCAQHMDQIRQHSEGHANVMSRLSSIDTTLVFLQKGVEGLTQSLQKDNKIIVDAFTQSRSPLSITDKGKEMINRIGVEEMVDSNWSRINAMIQSQSLQNPYDIQQFCIQQAVVFPEKFISAEQLNKIKIDAYNSGNPLFSYMRVIAVLVRDRYFYENHIDVSEVDANDPTK